MTVLILRYTVSLVSLLLLTSGLASAQDLVFSQFYTTPLHLSPAFAGNTISPRFSANYRLQWPSLPGKYESFSVGYDQFFRKYNSGIGATILADDAGDGIYRSFALDLHYAYRLQINREWFAKLGVQAGIRQSRLDFDRLIFLDQLSPLDGFPGPGTPSSEIRPEQPNATFMDVGAGFLLYNGSFYAGLGVKHLNTPDPSVLDINSNSYSGLSPTISLQAGGELPLKINSYFFRNSFLSPSLLVIKQADFYQIHAGAYLGLEQLFAGLSFRHTVNNADAAVITIGLRQEMWKIGYSYDVTVSGLPGPSGGSHEISMVYILDTPQPSKYNDCFGLFR